MLQKLKAKFVKRKSPKEAPTVGEHDVAPPVTFRAQDDRYGLFLVAEEPREPDRQSFDVDIIAIHGLNGDAFTTWTHANETLWLRDLIPKALPGCRVYTYGYPSQVAFNSSFASVKDYSRNLLSSLKGIRDPKNPRSIIFVCHSLGGLVCKQALIFAHEDNEDYGSLLQSFIGVIFLGTPHRGSNVANIGTTVGNIINSFSSAAVANLHKGVLRTDLLDFLRYDGRVLHDLSMSARNRLSLMKVVCCYETEPTPPLTSMVVNQHSATMGIPGEKLIPLYQNHRDVCRFPGETASYSLVSQALREMAQDCQLENEQVAILSESEKACLQLLSFTDLAEYNFRLPKPVSGTCQWILKHPSVSSWIEKGGNQMIWLTGHPGCGKTTMAYFLSQHFQNSQHLPAPSVYTYFCDDKVDKQNDGRNILAGLIYQIASHQPGLMQHMMKIFEQQGANMIQSFPAMWSIFENMLRDPQCDPVIIIVDALDECEEATCCDFLDSVHKFVHQGQESRDGSVRFFLTSRPALRTTYTFEPLDAVPGVISVSIEEGKQGYEADLQAVIRSKVEGLTRRRKCSAEIQEFLLKTLQEKADHTFLWVHLAIVALEKSPLVSKKDFQNITTFYRRTQYRFHDQHGCPPNTADVAADAQSAMMLTILDILGPFVRISDGKISLVHQTAKQFLLRPTETRETPLPLSEVAGENSALRMASACIAYLLLDDFSVDMSTLVEDENSGKPSSGDEASISTISSIYGDSLRPNAQICEAIASRHSFYHYAALNWYLHFAMCEEIAPVELIEAAERLVGITNIGRGTKCTERCENGKNHHRENWSYFLRQYKFCYSNPVDMGPLEITACLGLHRLMDRQLQRLEFPPRSSTTQSREGEIEKALSRACLVDQPEIVSLLLEKTHVDPNLRSLRHGWDTPLSITARHGHLDCVKYLLSCDDIDVNIRVMFGLTALHAACISGNLSIVECLIDREECDIDPVNDGGETPLFLAATGGHLDITCILLGRQMYTSPKTGKKKTIRKQADISHRDSDGKTLVSATALRGREAILEELLKLEEVDVNLPDHQGKSPLSWAATKGKAGTIQVLLKDKNSEVNMASIDHSGRNLFSWAHCGKKGSNLQVLSLLLEYKCPGIDDKDFDGRTPLLWAVETASPQYVDALVRTGLVDIEARDNNKRNVFSWAGARAAGGNPEVLRTLLDHKCPGTDEKDIDGKTPLAWAVQTKSPEFVDALISTGLVDIEARDNSGKCILWWALSYGYAPVVRTLLNHGVNLDSVDSGWVTHIMEEEEKKEKKKKKAEAMSRLEDRLRELLLAKQGKDSDEDV